MKKLYTLFLLSFVLLFAGAQAPKTLHNYTAISIKGDTIDLKKYHGKKVMVVNTASYCGYTYQFGLLQQLYSQYKNYGFEIIGFPSNDFGGQDPYADSAIDAFCTDKYNVSFQMMSRIGIISHDTAEVYKWLMHKELNGVASGTVTWNFNKFLIDEAGHWVRHILSPVSPLDTSITNWIKSPSVIPPVPPNVSEHNISTDARASFTEPVDIVTGVNAEERKPALIWRSANPTSTAFELTVYSGYKNLSIKIYSSDGRYINTMYEGAAANNQRISYPVTELPSGVYLIAILADGKQQTVRYVITQ